MTTSRSPHIFNNFANFSSPPVSVFTIKTPPGTILFVYADTRSKSHVTMSPTTPDTTASYCDVRASEINGNKTLDSVYRQQFGKRRRSPPIMSGTSAIWTVLRSEKKLVNFTRVSAANDDLLTTTDTFFSADKPFLLNTLVKHATRGSSMADGSALGMIIPVQYVGGKIVCTSNGCQYCC